ncbi:MAG TPA: hypothetical protein VI485_03880 [Vicinamibacterales bacterium]|nr:hypothetical protein [Vicinamibacterales bacterium]
MSTSVVVDTERVKAMTELLSRTDVPAESEEASVDDKLPKTLLPDIYFVLVAICHQTSPIGELPLIGTIDGRELKGWDYLREVCLRAAQRDNAWFTPERLAVVSEDDLNTILQIGHAPVHLNTLAERASLMRDIGERMKATGLRSITELFERCDRTLSKPDGSGFLAEISKFRAFRDPVRKKSAFFVALMQNQALWTLRDPNNLPSPVDYHEVRGHLRCGTVQITEAALAERVRKGEEVSEADDIQIRAAVSEAISQIGIGTGLAPSRLHYLFWNIYRGCCTHEKPHCHACPSDCKLPERYKALTTERRRCLFSDACASRDLSEKLIEHKTVTDFY